MRIQIIGTVVDLYGDASTVFGDGGSKDLSEFLGRAGVTLVKAGATAAIGSALAAVTTAGLAIVGGSPVVVVAALVLGGYILTATLIDLADTAFSIKDRAAAAAR